MVSEVKQQPAYREKELYKWKWKHHQTRPVVNDDFSEQAGPWTTQRMARRRGAKSLCHAVNLNVLTACKTVQFVFLIRCPSTPPFPEGPKSFRLEISWRRDPTVGSCELEVWGGMCFLLLQFISCLNFLEDGVGSREKATFCFVAAGGGGWRGGEGVRGRCIREKL